jgi:hypothetical protein
VVRVLVFVVVPVALVIAGVAYVAMNPERLLGVDGEELGSSLAREASARGEGICEEERGSRWSCSVYTNPGSDGERRYRLTSDDDGCWDASRANGTGRRISGCVDIWDYAMPDTPDG